MAAKKGLAIVIGGKPPGGMPPGMDDPNQPPGKMPDSAGASDPSDLTGDNAPDNVPLSALAMPDDTEQMQPPEVGDEVNYQVTGKVISIEGDVAQVQKTAVNGQPVGGNEDDPQSGGNDDDEGQSLRSDAASMGMLAILIALLLSLAPSARAQNAALEGSGSMTNACVMPNMPARIYRIMGYNSTNVPICIQVFQTNAVPLTGALPLIILPVPALSPYTLDFSYYGMQMDGCTVCASTTTNTLTLAPTPCISIEDIESQR